MVEKKYCVYKHTCPNGKVYIGITRQKPTERWRNGMGYKHNEHFMSAIRKYGWDNIMHEVVEDNLTLENASNKEVELIKQYRSSESEFGYNATTGGISNIPNTETKKKMSRAIAKQYAIGSRSRVRSEESKKKTSETLRRKFESGELCRVISEEQKKKLSEAHQGKKLSEDHKIKINKSSHKKAVVQCDGDRIVKIYDGIRLAGRELGIDYTVIVKVLKGQKRTAGGYYWKYLEQE